MPGPRPGSRPSPARRLLGAGVVLAALAAGIAGGVNPVAAEAGDVTFHGRGWGHARGMGQYGAFGYAVDHGWSYRQILDHFYGGTTMGTVPATETVRVRLTARDDQPLTVAVGRGVLRTTADASLGTGAPALRIERVGPNRFALSRGSSCAGPFTSAGTVDARFVRVAPPVEGDDPAGMLQLCDPTRIRWYRGTLEILDADGAARVVNEVAVEQYLRSSVSREVPAGWATAGGGAGVEALKAQAVASRSYALGSNRYPYADLCDSGACQSYAGHAGAPPGGTPETHEVAAIDAAIRATAGEVRMRDGRILPTEYSSSTGGYTAGGTFPAVPDVGDDTGENPNRTWTATVPASRIEAAFGRAGFAGVDIVERNGLGADGGRVVTVRVRFADGAEEVSGARLRSLLGLKSDWFSLTPIAGAGHGGAGAGPPAAPAAAATPAPASETGPAGYVLDGFGGLHPFGGAPAPSPTAYFGGWDVFRRVVAGPTGAGFVLDAYGNLHPFGAGSQLAPRDPDPGPEARWPGWDVARDVTLLPGHAAAGYVLDAFGGVHAFGGAPVPSGGPYWPGWDVARRIAVDPSGATGYVLDAFGGLHPFAIGGGAAPPVPRITAYWPGWDVARDLVLVGSGRGYVVDAFGGLHPFGDAPAVAGTGYRAAGEFLAGAAAAPGGAVVYADRSGVLHGAPPPTPVPAPAVTWPGFPIARDVTLVG